MENSKLFIIIHYKNLLLIRLSNTFPRALKDKLNSHLYSYPDGSIHSAFVFSELVFHNECVAVDEGMQQVTVNALTEFERKYGRG